MMQMSLKSAFCLYHKEFESKIGFSMFCSLRPRNVRLISMTKRDFCLCFICVNIKYKLLAVNRHILLPEMKIRDEYHLIDKLLCAKQAGSRFHQPDCVSGACASCNDYKKTIEIYFQHEIAKCEEKQITWNRWERRDVNGKIRRQLVSKTDSFKNLVMEFAEDLTAPTRDTSFVRHLHTASWQHKEYNNIKHNLPKGWVLFVIDFAKNRNVIYQDEIKEAFFGQKQITIHPIVMYYRSEKFEIVRDVMICITDDNIHDCHAVKTFMNEAEQYLKNAGINIVRKVIFSDGCSSQYKSVKCFTDLSLSNIATNRNFFGSEHGKGESDGETGVLNKSIERAIIARQVIIQNAKDLFDWAVENLTIDEELTKRHYSLIKDINRNRPYIENTKPTKPMGCRKIHQSIGYPNKPYQLVARDLSCFCDYCLKEEFENCRCLSYVKPMRNITLRRCAEDKVSVVEVQTEYEKIEEMSFDGLMADILSEVNFDEAVIDEAVIDDAVNVIDDSVSGNIEKGDDILFPCGTHVLIRHGSESIPAIVTSENPLAVTYYKLFKGNMYSIEEADYVILAKDIVCKIKEPEIMPAGSRLYYIFKS